MNFMSKRRRLKFQVSCSLESLSSVPLVSGVLFAKLRLRDGGTFSECSTREEVKNHMVRWRKEYSFICKFTANPNTLVLESRYLRISVRKELKGGRAYEKLGYVDLNLAEYAGLGRTSRRYLLEGYDSRHRQDNSILEIAVTMSLQSGDPVFKGQQPSGGIPAPLDPIAVALLEETRVPDIGFSSGSLEPAVSAAASGCAAVTASAAATVAVTASSSAAEAEASSLASSSSGFSSLSKKQQRSSAGVEAGDRGHSRNSSYNSEMSNYGSYGRGAQARHTGAAGVPTSGGLIGSCDMGHTRNPSSGSNREASRIVQSVRRLESERTERIDSTRVDPDELVDELLGEMKLNVVEPHAPTAVACGAANGLQLYIADDGSTSIGSAKRRPR